MKSEPITKDKFVKTDSYRAQVQLPDKMTWAAGYNAISDWSPELGSELRDAFAKHIQNKVLEHFKALLYSKDFKEYYKQWVSKRVDESVFDEYLKWKIKHGIDV